MLKGLLAAAGLVGFVAVATPAAQAMPVDGIGSGDASVTLVAGGCGPYRHRGPYGGCRPNGGPRVFGGPFYGRPFARGCFVRATPFGPRRVCR